VPSRRRIRSALAPAALVLLALAGCGGGDAPTSASVRTTTVMRTVTAPASTTTAPSATGTTAQPPPDPSAPLALSAAEQALGARGYTALSERDWRPDQRLKALIGIGSTMGASRKELAFFFVGDRFIGTDTTAPSARIEMAAQGGESVTLRYALYRPGDGVDDPSGGGTEVTYRWTGARLVPQGAIPSAATDAPLSRR
jgi:LppP/LprE lipoprotein